MTNFITPEQVALIESAERPLSNPELIANDAERIELLTDAMSAYRSVVNESLKPVPTVSPGLEYSQNYALYTAQQAANAARDGDSTDLEIDTLNDLAITALGVIRQIAPDAPDARRFRAYADELGKRIPRHLESFLKSCPFEFVEPLIEILVIAQRPVDAYNFFTAWEAHVDADHPSTPTEQIEALGARLSALQAVPF